MLPLSLHPISKTDSQFNSSFSQSNSKVVKFESYLEALNYFSKHHPHIKISPELSSLEVFHENILTTYIFPSNPSINSNFSSLSTLLQNLSSQSRLPLNSSLLTIKIPSISLINLESLLPLISNQIEDISRSFGLFFEKTLFETPDLIESSPFPQKIDFLSSSHHQLSFFDGKPLEWSGILEYSSTPIPIHFSMVFSKSIPSPHFYSFEIPENEVLIPLWLHLSLSLPHLQELEIFIMHIPEKTNIKILSNSQTIDILKNLISLSQELQQFINPLNLSFHEINTNT